MGNTVVTKYRVEVTDNKQVHMMAWQGRATSERLEAWILKYGKSYESRGVNFHVSKEIGYIPYPLSAAIVDQKAGMVVAEWRAPMFMVW